MSNALIDRENRRSACEWMGRMLAAYDEAEPHDAYGANALWCEVINPALSAMCRGIDRLEAYKACVRAYKRGDHEAAREHFTTAEEAH